MTSASTLERPRSLSQSSQDRCSPSPTESRSKALLFCPCGREAPPEAWPSEHAGNRRRLVCPDCGETLTVR